MDWIRRRVRFSLIILIAIIGSGCVQQTTAGPGSEDAWPPSASTLLAVQATRIAALETANATLATELARHREFISYLATRMPPFAATPRSGPPTPFHEFAGGLSIEGGKCCIGGVAGQKLRITVDFAAHSPFAEVASMRVATAVAGLPPDAIELAEWEPFVPRKSFSVTPPINWVGFYVAVQYRDALGNLSQVFLADISVEGVPPTPTGIPPS